MVGKASNIDYTTIIVVRERDPFLGQAIKSVLNQTLEPDRVLVIVNGTRNPNCESIRVAESFGPPVTGILVEQQGMVPALNKGLSLLDTPYVAFLDSDDLWVGTKQERQISILNKNPEFDAINGIIANFRDDVQGNRVFLNRAQASLRGAMTFRTSVFQRFGEFDSTSTHFTHLYRWYSNAIQQGLTVFRLDDVVLLRRIHSDNGWVRRRDEGISDLQSELRMLMRQKRSSENLKK